MSLSPLPPDPYVALGVSKDADLGQIRTSHRKLVLKYHPDRIKGDNSEEKNRAKNEFQKVQQAYEILSDPVKRSRYDDQLKLIELQKERMTRNAAHPSAFTPKPTSGPTSVRREMRTDGVFYEERAPPTSYFDSRDRFDEPLPRAAARKHEAPYEKERKPSVAKTTERKSSRMAEGISIAAGLKAAGSRAKDRVRETHAKSQEQRDREKRRERSEKQTGRRAAFSAEVESETDSDTIGPQHSSRSRRPSPRVEQEPTPTRSRPSSVRRGAQSYDEEGYDDEKWEQHHRNGREYIAESQKRPNLARNGSDAYSYWGSGDVPSARRSGSDSEKRPSSSRRTKADDSRNRPSMPVHSSAPSNLRPYVVEERAPQRAQTNSYPEREHRPAPSLGRSQTMPTSRSVKKDSLPTRGSNLKHAETQDSGYYSSSNPHTPEMKGESPPPSRENSKKKGSSTKYQIVNAESDDDRASRIRILDSDDDSRHRRYRSPEPERRERERERERDRDRDRERYREPERERERDRDRDRERGDHGRPRVERERPIRTESDRNISSRTVRSTAPTSFPRGEFRHEQPLSRSTSAATRPKLFGEVSTDDKEHSYSYQYDPTRVKTTTHRPPTMAGYGVPRFREAEDDYSPGSTFKDHMRAPHMRRPSAAY